MNEYSLYYASPVYLDKKNLEWKKDNKKLILKEFLSTALLVPGDLFRPHATSNITQKASNIFVLLHL